MENIPPLLGALAAFILVFSVFAPKLNSGFLFPNAQNVFGFFNVLIHILGLQIFLAPAYASPMLTLYFIGLIIVFYTIYPFIVMISKDAKHLLFVSSIVFLGFLLISRTFNIIDPRFFVFFPIFVFGILTCRKSLFEKSGTIFMRMPFVQILLAALPVIFVLIVVLGSRTVLFLDPKVSLTIDSAGSGTMESSMVISMLSSVANSLGMNYTTLKFIIDSLLLNIFIVMFCSFEYRFAKKFITDKFSSSLSSFFTYIATSSYCVYLFHRPFLAIWNAGTNFISNPMLRDIIVIFVAIPLLFFISYHVQMFELNLEKYISHEKVPGKAPSFKGSIKGSKNKQQEK